jgi:AbrB family looped-hinge helix DNA binding protein
MNIHQSSHTRRDDEKRGASVMTTKGQVTIPRTVREYLGVKPADTVEFAVVNGAVVVQKPQHLRLDDVFGAVTPTSRPEDFKRRRDVAIKEHIARSVSLKP